MEKKARVFFSDAKSYEKEYYLSHPDYYNYEFHFYDSPLDETSIELAQGFDALFCFVNDKLSKDSLKKLKEMNINKVFLRCAGFNNVDISYAKENGIHVARVPSYSPESIAEFTLALLLNLNRKVHKSYQRTREMNFDLNNLVGNNIHGKTIGIIGTGKIGAKFSLICNAMGAKVIAHDIDEDSDLIAAGIKYCELDELLKTSDVISFHCPLVEETKHLLNCTNIMSLKKGCKIINTGRGGLIDSKALILGLKKSHLGGVALDVYEEEEGLFFKDHSFENIQDETILRLVSFSNVIISSHQAYLTEESLRAISTIGMESLKLSLNNETNDNFLS